MPLSGDNPRFQLLVNGKSVAIGGIESYGVVSGSLSWVSRDPALFAVRLQDDPTLSKEEYLDKSACVILTGLDLTTNRHVEWNWINLQIGDVVAFNVLPPGPFDESADSGFE